MFLRGSHLLRFARGVRKHGVNTRIGFFLHLQYPRTYILNAFPPHAELLEQLCNYDTFGFQTEHDRTAFLCRIAMQTRLSDLDYERYQAWRKAFSTV
ncbi:alpha,alpha-trehalose-phosphate synthase, partial [Klebsiella pneumoniae]